jgi:protein-tyrosine phosphatase
MKKVLKIFAILFSLIVAYYIWHVHFNYRFETISKNKVYKSALIPPNKLENFLIPYHIKTVIDLLEPSIQDKLNPAKQDEIDKEDEAINNINKKYNLNIKHINIPSTQVPNENTLKQFYKVLDNSENYPVLIHCYHGTGRAVIYSAIYRIEYENWTNKQARDKTRLMVEGLGYKSSFANGKSKGDFLMNYKRRKIDVKTY